MKSPCHNCKDRKLYCHSKCKKPEYIKFEDKKKKAHEVKRKASFLNYKGGSYGL